MRNDYARISAIFRADLSVRRKDGDCISKSVRVVGGNQNAGSVDHELANCRKIAGDDGLSRSHCFHQDDRNAVPVAIDGGPTWKDEYTRPRDCCEAMRVRLCTFERHGIGNPEARGERLEGLVGEAQELAIPDLLLSFIPSNPFADLGGARDTSMFWGEMPDVHSALDLAMVFGCRLWGHDLPTPLFPTFARAIRSNADRVTTHAS